MPGILVTSRCPFSSTASMQVPRAEPTGFTQACPIEQSKSDEHPSEPEYEPQWSPGTNADPVPAVADPPKRRLNLDLPLRCSLARGSRSLASPATAAPGGFSVRVVSTLGFLFRYEYGLHAASASPSATNTIPAILQNPARRRSVVREGRIRVIARSGCAGAFGAFMP